MSPSGPDIAIVLPGEPHRQLALQTGLSDSGCSSLLVDATDQQRSRRCHGLISACPRSELALHLRRLPTIWLWQQADGIGLEHDEAACGETAAEHLLQLGHRQLLILANRHLLGHARLQGFRQAASAHGATVADCQLEELPGRLQHAQAPYGLFAFSDALAAQAMHKLLAAAWRIPEEVAILSVNDNPAVVDAAPIPLSSVRQDWQGLGRLAGRLLQAMLAGRPLPPTHAALPPRGVVMRRSTEEIAVDDALLRAVLLLLRDDPRHLTCEQVARTVGCSRSTLDRHYRRLLGRSIGADLRQRRLRRAYHLLHTSKEPLAVIAEQCGYRHSSNLIAAFRQRYGCNPGQCRQRRA